MRDLQNEDSDEESPSKSEEDNEEEKDDPSTASSPLSVSSPSGPIDIFSSVPSLTPSGDNAGDKRELSEDEDEIELMWSDRTTIKELIAFEPLFGKGKKTLRIHQRKPIFTDFI